MEKLPAENSKNEDEWFLLERAQRVDLFQGYPIIQAICQNEDFKKNFRVSMKKGGIIISEDYSDMIFDSKEWENNAAYLLDLVKEENYKIFRRVNNEIYNASKDLEEYSDTVFLKKEISFEEALLFYEDFLDLIKKLYSWAFFYEILELGKNKHLTQYLQNIIKERLKDYENIKCNSRNYFITLTSATRDSWVEKERIEFLKILKSLENEEGADLLIKNHTEKFFWIPSLGSFEFWNEDYFFKKMKSFKKNPLEELDKQKNRKTELLRKIADAESKLNLSCQEKGIFQLIRELSFLKDFRRGIQNKAFLVIFLKVFPILSKRLNTKKENLRWMTLNEIKVGAINEDEIKSKMRGCSYLINGEKEEILNEIFCFNEEGSKKEDNLKEIRGVVACKGDNNFIKGRANIVLNREDIKKFKKGDILISHMTNPEIIEAISTAKAIVTDMGGITCHASIVSRELEVPCIIGTKIATKILKSGDLIEMNMEDGTIKINQ